MADTLVAAPDGAFLHHLWRRWSPGWTPDPADIEPVIAAFARAGVARAALAYYRTAFAPPLAERAAESAGLAAIPLRVPVLGLSGESDSCMSSEVFEASMPDALFPLGVAVETWPDAGHFLHLECPERIANRIVDWLRAQT